MAKTFGQLPSHVLANGTTFDIQVANALAKWENDIRNGHNPATPQLSQQEMMDMIKSVRERNDKEKSAESN